MFGLVYCTDDVDSLSQKQNIALRNIHWSSSRRYAILNSSMLEENTTSVAGQTT
jgi:hypothetical protein